MTKDEEVRNKMHKYRESLGLDIQHMSILCGCTQTLLYMVEYECAVTHPMIAKRISDIYKLSEEDAETLLPINRRPHGGDYEPDRYVINNRITSHHGKEIMLERIPEDLKEMFERV